MTEKHYREKTWRGPRQQLKASAVSGTGAFAGAPIHKGEVVEIIGGMVMTEEEFCAFQAKNTRYNAIQIGENLHLVESLDVTEAREGGSINHSCDSNLWLADEVTLVARRDIAEGEELTIDYSLFTVQTDWQLDQICQCGSKDCRHTVTGDDWQLLEVQDRYYPHFSPFINARIDRLNNQKS